MKIGFFGGTFAPVHNAHINIVKGALKQLNLDKMIVMPSGQPPHKYSYIDKTERLNLTQLAFEDLKNVEVSDYEIKSGIKNYSYLTLAHIKELYPNAEIFFIMGGDSLRDFSLWKKPEEIARLATLAVAQRGDSLKNDAAFNSKKYGAKVVFLDVIPSEISSTEIRINYEFGIDNTKYLPQNVDNYIKQKGLLCKHAEMVDKLKALLEPSRFLHTYNVVKAGQEFARANSINTENAFIACLLHDCGKNIPVMQWENYGFFNEEKLLKPLIHCALGVKVAQKDFFIKDQKILDAIRYHTTGRPNMTPLEKLVFVADKAEKTRRYDVSNYYSIALKSIDKAFVMVLTDMYGIAVKKYGKNNVDTLTVATMRYYNLF